MMLVQREWQTNAENSNQDDDGTINWIKTRTTWKDIHIICWVFDSNSNLYIFLAFLILTVTIFTNRLSFRTQIHKCWIKKYNKTNASTYRKMQIQIRITIIIHKLSKSWIVWSSIGGIWGHLGKLWSTEKYLSIWK